MTNEQRKSDVKRWHVPETIPVIPYHAPSIEVVSASDYDAAIAALAADCNIMCNALQRIEAGEPEPRMIARRTLEHWSQKAALSSGKTEGDKV
jgi:hypothetical protein